VVNFFLANINIFQGECNFIDNYFMSMRIVTYFKAIKSMSCR
jgi:hypothetical protein